MGNGGVVEDARGRRSGAVRGTELWPGLHGVGPTMSSLSASDLR